MMVHMNIILCRGPHNWVHIDLRLANNFIIGAFMIYICILTEQDEIKRMICNRKTSFLFSKQFAIRQLANLGSMCRREKLTLQEECDQKYRGMHLCKEAFLFFNIQQIVVIILYAPQLWRT